jgi:hypothetical protein
MLRKKSMPRIFFSSLFAILIFVAGAHADSFEFLTYTPPLGWTKQVLNDQTTYRRPNGIGMIAFTPSYQTVGLPADEFAKIWAGRVGTTLRGPTPPPQVERVGNYTVAIGGTKVNAQGALTTISLVAFVGHGRALGVLGMAAGDEAEREMMTFFDTLEASGGAAATTNSVPAAGVEVEFDVPAGYVQQRDGNTIVLRPTKLDLKTPCIYGISPARPTRGSLDMDARAAILEALPGWQLKNDHEYNAWKGVTGAGWPYFWLRRDVGQLQGGSAKYLAAMSMAFPAGPGRVNIIWGFGDTSACTLDDTSFVRLLQSLRPRGWTSDGGKALGQQLHGTWRDTQAAGMSQYKFLPNGRYEYALGTSVTMGNLETRTGSVKEGRYELRGSELILTPDRDGRGVGKYRIRIYDDLRLGKWTRTMSLLNESGNPMADVHYLRVEN